MDHGKFGRRGFLAGLLGGLASWLAPDAQAARPRKPFAWRREPRMFLRDLPAGTVMIYQYDAQGRCTSVTQSWNAPAAAGAASSLSRLESRDGNVTAYSYDIVPPKRA